jgi:hypothetical protein
LSKHNVCREYGASAQLDVGRVGRPATAGNLRPIANRPVRFRLHGTVKIVVGCKEVRA